MELRGRRAHWLIDLATAHRLRKRISAVAAEKPSGEGPSRLEGDLGRRELQHQRHGHEC